MRPPPAARAEPWLNAGRATAIARVLVAAWMVCIALMLWGQLAGSGGGAPTLARDFASFWTAARMALGGEALEAYHPEAHLAAQQALYGSADAGYAAFFYPPPFLLVCLPLGLLPFGAAAAAWALGGAAFYAAGIRRLLPGGAVAALAFPAAFVNLAYAQNGFLTAGLFAFAGVWLDRRPWLAGACLGALACKPQFGLLAPVALAAAGRWRAFGGAAGAALGLAAAATLAFGPEVWARFLGVSTLARLWMQNGNVGFAKMVSVFAALRQFGAPVDAAYAGQAAVALGCAGLLASIVARRPGGPAEMASLACCTLLATPFALHYDLAIAAVPLAWLAAEAGRAGWRPGERAAAAALFAAPLAILVAAFAAGLPLAPPALAALLLLLWRRRAAALHRPATTIPE